MFEDKFSFKMIDFKENVATLFKSFQNSKDFTDVTLATNDGHQVGAHKIILTALSPVFRNMLQDNQHVQPIIFLRGVNQEQLSAILDFMYQGEAKIDKSNLDEFIKLAEELKLKGLAKEKIFPNPFFIPDNECLTPEKDMWSMNKKDKINKSYSINEINTLKSNEAIVPWHVKDKTESTTKYRGNYNKALSDSMSSETQEQLTEVIQSNIEYKEGENSIWSCKICGKTRSLKNKLEQHMETHVTGISYPCNMCGKIFKSRPSYYNHKSKLHKPDQHDQKKVTCDICPFSSVNDMNIKKHMKTHSQNNTVEALQITNDKSN